MNDYFRSMTPPCLLYVELVTQSAYQVTLQVPHSDGKWLEKCGVSNVPTEFVGAATLHFVVGSRTFPKELNIYRGCVLYDTTLLARLSLWSNSPPQYPYYAYYGCMLYILDATVIAPTQSPKYPESPESVLDMEIDNDAPTELLSLRPIEEVESVLQDPCINGPFKPAKHWENMGT